MNYQRIAEIVHELIKSPNSLNLPEKAESLKKLNINELNGIQRAFSRLEVSGDVLTFEAIPLDYW